MIRISPANTFIERPAIGDRFIHLTTGEQLTVAAVWEKGVVFEEGLVCSPVELLSKFDPQCPACHAFHEPEYPHELTPAFRLHIQWRHGRTATREDTFAHCSGLLKAAAETACA